MTCPNCLVLEQQVAVLKGALETLLIAGLDELVYNEGYPAGAPESQETDSWMCRECGEEGATRADVKHLADKACGRAASTLSSTPAPDLHAHLIKLVKRAWMKSRPGVTVSVGQSLTEDLAEVLNLLGAKP